MFNLIALLFGVLVRPFRTRGELVLESLAFRQQLAVLKRQYPRPRLALLDRLFWIGASRFWAEWKQASIVVTPEFSVGWHRAGFRWDNTYTLTWALLGSLIAAPTSKRK
jgi:hypothetical protein